MSRIKNRIFLLTTLFFIICCICEYLQFRKGIFVINLIAVISFFIIFLKNKKTKAWSIYLFWVFFIVSGLTVSLYNHAAYGEVTIILKLLGYIMLLIYAYSKQKKNKIKSLDFLVYAIVFVINLYVVFEVVKMISSSISASHMIVLFSIYGIVHILLYMNAFRYRLQYDSRSKYFLVFAAFLTSAEVLVFLVTS